MNLPLFVISCICIFTCQVSAQANNYEYSEQRPWSAFVYAVYPFYNSEALLEVWKSEKPVESRPNVITLSTNEQLVSLLNGLNRHNDTAPKTQNDLQYLANESAAVNADQSSKNRQRQQSNYRNRFKGSENQNE